jgi:hypothetical protein
MRRVRAWVLGGALLVLAAPLAWAADDDLSIVRKAVAADAGGTTTKDEKAAPPRKASAPQWLRVRIVDKGEKKAKVSINLPLSLVKALGDEVPLDWHCKNAHIKVSEVLAALQSGQEFVQIEDEQSTIRVYVE